MNVSWNARPVLSPITIMIHHGKLNRCDQTNQSYKSDEQLISPYHNIAQSNIKVLREAKMIIKEQSLDSVGCLT